MEPVSNVGERSGGYFPPSISREKISNCFLGFFSAKQTARSDSIINCCYQVIPHLKRSLVQLTWRIYFTAYNMVFFQNDPFFSEALLAIETVNHVESAMASYPTGEITINEEERRAMELLFSKPISEELYCELNAYLTFIGKENLWKTLKACKEIFLPLQSNITASLREKVKKIEWKLAQQTRDFFLREEEKLTPQDMRFLIAASSRVKILENLQINFSEELKAQWRELSQINNSKTMELLKNYCLEGYKPGRLFFYDWSFIEILDFRQFDFSEIFKHLFYGRIPHVAIIVKDSFDKPNLSHVNGATRTHAFHPIRFPIIGALGNFAELDISSLLPEEISFYHRNLLQKYFSEKFIEIASQAHPNITIEWKHLLTFFCGHKSLSTHDLSEINLDLKQEQLCSSYVGTVFLKAIHEVNLEISRLGYKANIPHPFGNHEILDRVDIPRLLYHLKRLKVIRSVAIDEFVSKVFRQVIL